MQIPPSLPLTKPKTFMLLGIGLLILGVFYIFGMLLNVAYASVPAMRETNPIFKAMDQDPTFKTIHNTSVVFNGLLGAVAVVAGIGLIKSKEWGRKMGMGWAALTLLMLPFGLWMTNKYVQPAMAQMQNEMMKGQPMPEGFGKGMEVFTLAITIVTTVFWVSFCIAVIYFLARPKMKAWCALQGNRALA
jgi:hypothetical protein